MDIFDLFWNAEQQRELQSLRGQLDRLRLDQDLTGSGPLGVRGLAQENLELKVRLGLLVRLLIAKGVITAQEYATLLADAQSNKVDPTADGEGTTAVPGS